MCLVQQSIYNMKNLKFTLLACICLFVFNACQQDPCFSKQQFVDSSNAFFEEFQKKAASGLSENDKSDFETRYENMLESCYKKYKSELSDDEKAEFWQSTVRFYLKKEGGIFNVDFNNQDDPVRKYISEELESMADTSSAEFERLMENLLDNELPNLIDSFVGKVEEIGEELKESLKEEDNQ